MGYHPLSTGQGKQLQHSCVDSTHWECEIHIVNANDKCHLRGHIHAYMQMAYVTCVNTCIYMLTVNDTCRLCWHVHAYVQLTYVANVGMCVLIYNCHMPLVLE